MDGNRLASLIRAAEGDTPMDAAGRAMALVLLGHLDWSWHLRVSGGTVQYAVTPQKPVLVEYDSRTRAFRQS